MTKMPSRNIGCLTPKRRCPCGGDQCYIRVEESGDEVLQDVAALPSEPEIVVNGMLDASSEATAAETPFVGQSFETAEAALEFYTGFARRNGFAIRTERSKGNASHPMGIYKRELVCHRAGAYRPRKIVEVQRQRNKKSSRCKCEAQMTIKKKVSKGIAQWLVTHFSNVHNHELLGSDEVRHLPAYRNISPTDRERVLALAKAGCTVALIMRALEMEKGLKSDQLTFTERDLRNFLQGSKCLRWENDSAELLRSCRSTKERSPDFRYEYTMDRSDKLENICWSYPDSVRAYKVFGDSVVFDTTYRLYAYDRPFGIWFGMDNYGNAVFFACVLLQDEEPSSLRWALQAFLRLMDGKLPNTMLTDLDPGLKEAVMSELPGTKHAVPYWYVTPKLSTWFAASLGSRLASFSTEFRKVLGSQDLDEFTLKWNQMVGEFGMSADRHIILLTFNHDCWAMPFLRGWFFGRLLETDFSAAIQSFYRVFLNSQTRLRDFVEQVRVAVDLQDQAGEEATTRLNYRSISMRTCMPIEEHAAGVLTPYAFQLLQKELVSSMQLAVYETQGRTYIVRHRLELSGSSSGGGHVVVQSVETNDEWWRCSCKDFETCGILCCHVARVLSLRNCFELPDKYLPLRWQRDSSLFPKSSGHKYRFRALHALTSILVQESAATKERFDHVHWHMSKLLEQVRDMPVAEATGYQSPGAMVDIARRRPRGRPKKAGGGGEGDAAAATPARLREESACLWDPHAEQFGAEELS